MEIQFATTLYIIVMNTALAFTVVKMLRHNSTEAKTMKMAFMIFGSWLLATLLLFGNNTVLPNDISSFALFSIILVGVGLAGFVLSPLFKALVTLPQEFLLMPQAFRMFFGAGFIIEAVFGIIPAGYGAVDGILHIATAFLATTLAIYVARGAKVTKSLVLVNLFGLLDIVVVAAGIAFFILGDIGIEHNVFYAVFFAAPIFIWLHLISLYKVYKDSKKVS
ncbi:MAG TPA: hypothetical protein ENK39_04070 [Epsilonproteobacteria bacterium]|nr:hypothetical protein [Campylobacterota bacterium]